MLMGRGSVHGFPPKTRRCSLSIQSIAMCAAIQPPIQRAARWFPQGIKKLGHEADNSYTYTSVSQMKNLNIFCFLIYWKPKVHSNLIFLCSVVLPPVGTLQTMSIIVDETSCGSNFLSHFQGFQLTLPRNIEIKNERDCNSSHTDSFIVWRLSNHSLFLTFSSFDIIHHINTNNNISFHPNLKKMTEYKHFLPSFHRFI